MRIVKTRLAAIYNLLVSDPEHIGKKNWSKMYYTLKFVLALGLLALLLEESFSKGSYVRFNTEKLSEKSCIYPILFYVRVRKNSTN